MDQQNMLEDFDIEIVELEPTSDDIEIIEATASLAISTETISEQDLPQSFEVSEVDSEPMAEIGEWQTPADFEAYVVASARRLPQVYANSKNSLKRVFAYLEKLSEDILEGVQQDAAYAELSEQQLRTLDNIEEGIEEAMKTVASILQGKVVKTATKSSQFTPFVNPFIFGLARILINGKVSQGKNIESLYGSLSSKYKLSEREQLELYFILNDMGHSIRSSFVEGLDMAEQYQS